MEIITNVTNMAVDSANLTCDNDFWGKSVLGHERNVLFLILKDSSFYLKISFFLTGANKLAY